MYYKITFFGEGTGFARVQMEESEARQFYNILKTARENLQEEGSYMGGCSIDLDSASEVERPQIIHTCKKCGYKWELSWDENKDRCSYQGGKNNCITCSVDSPCSDCVCQECGSVDWDFQTEKGLSLVGVL